MARRKRRQGSGGPPRKGLKPSPPSTPRRAAAQTAPRAPLSGPLPTPLLDSLRCPTEVGAHPSQKSSRVPIEYRAQITGRSERHYIKPKPKDAPPGWRTDLQIWIDEWSERVDHSSPFTQEGLRLLEVQIDWRLISNSGVDDGVIRPVIGAGGWPMIPGSGIKGLFRRACPPERLLRWCGSQCGDGALTLSPGILRFHGAWPAESSWTSSLLDVVHPQQNWQVGFSHGGERHSAFGLVSLYRPRLQIGLSCTESTIPPGEWEEIEATLKRALKAGIGGRTCVGYGSSGRLSGDLLFECGLEGQGPAAKLLDDTVEFRPTMFRAAIRGMALRLFGGVSDARTAQQVVGHLFGALGKEEGQHVGLLATAYTDPMVDLGSSGRDSWNQPIYATSGQLQWRLTRKPKSVAEKDLLTELVAALHGLTMSLGGFGKGWRRPDHRIFKQDYRKTPIGCHWQWLDVAQLPSWIQVQTAEELGLLLQRSRRIAGRWLEATGNQAGNPAPWREVIDSRRMFIWTRRAEHAGDAEVIHWFHERSHGDPARDPRDLKRSDLAGRMSQVGLIWNRMLPIRGSSSSTPSAAASRSASPVTSGGGATARPMNPTARPGGSAMARPSMSRQTSRAPKGEVSIAVHFGPYLEILVLHQPSRNASAESQQHYKTFVKTLDQGAGAQFKRLSW